MKSLTRYGGIALLLISALLSVCFLAACGNPGAGAIELPSVKSCGLGQYSLRAIEFGRSFTGTGGGTTVDTAYSPGAEPDLVIESITWSPEGPSKGDAVNISAAVKNQGSAMALPSSVKLYVDGSFKEEQHLQNIEAGGVLVKDFTWLAQQGSHLIRMVVDEEDCVSESDENNNEKSVTISPLTPDLIVTSITWSPTIPKAGENVTFSFTVNNQGDGAAASSVGIPYIGNERLSSVTFGAIEPGGVSTKSLKWLVEPGFHTVKLVVDPIEKIIESDESNNEKAVSFPPIVPDLFVKTVIWSPVNPSVGETVTFSITIGNQGNALASTPRFHLFLNGESSASKTGRSVVAGSSETVDVEWIARPGQHKVRIVVDPFNKIIELDEDNNEAVAVSLLSVRAADLVIDSVTLSPEEALPGETLTFLATVKNRGHGEAPPTQVDFYVDGVRVAFSLIGPLPYGNIKKETFTWVAEEGSHTIRITADANDEVMESNEENNEKLVFYPVPPDLVIKEIALSPPEPAESDNVTFIMVIENEGDMIAEYFRIACYVDSVYLGYVSGGPIESGVTDNITFVWAAGYGEHNFRAVVDPFDNLLEVSEKNNEMVTIFWVDETSSLPSSTESDKPDAAGREASGTILPERVETDYDKSQANFWFFSILAVGIVIVLGYLFFEYRRRQY